MKNIMKVGRFEFIIMIIIENEDTSVKTINLNLNRRYKHVYSKGYISKVLKKMKEFNLIKYDKGYKLTKSGRYYVELYNKL